MTQEHTPTGVKLPEVYPQGLGFPAAMELVTGGMRVTRKEWGDRKIFLSLQDGWLMLSQPGKPSAKVLLSQVDLEATDWLIANDLG